MTGAFLEKNIEENSLVANEELKAFRKLLVQCGQSIVTPDVQIF
jgi:hypothetical protein